MSVSRTDRSLQSLVKEQALVLRRPVQLAELLEAQPAIKAGRLKAERVQPNRVAAAFQRAALRRLDQSAPEALPAQRLRYPDVLDIEPAAVCRAQEPGHRGLPPIPREHSERVARLVAWPLLLVERFQPVQQPGHVCLRRIIGHVEILLAKHHRAAGSRNPSRRNSARSAKSESAASGT